MGSGAATSLITTKLVPPRRTGADVARERLLERMVEARRMRCIVLQGGAGAGKTSVLAAWQQALVPLGFEVAWLSLSPDDDEPARFLDYVLASLGRLDPAIVREASLLSGLGADRESIERMVIALVQGLAAYGREVVLVLDDVQHIKDPAILDGALQFLLDYAPSNFHLALATRRPVPLALGRLHAEGQLLELDARDLRFSPAESTQFLRARLGSVNAREAARLHSLSDGWPAGLELLALDLRHLEPGAAPRRLPIHDPGSFSAYFEREVLERLDPVEIDALVRVSICVRFCARLAAALLARDEAGAAAVAAARLIARLERENLFIVPVESADRERWYRLHPLLREVLLARVQALLPEDQHALHARAAAWFENEGLVEEAVRHRLDAGQAETAAALVERHAEDLQLRGDFRGLASILRRLPEAALAGRVTLRFLQAQLLMRTRQFDAYERAIATLEREVPADDLVHRFQLVTARAALHVQRDDTAAAAALLPQLADLPPGLDGWLVGAQKNLVSLVLLHDGDAEGARRAQQEGPPRLVGGEPLQGGSQGIQAGRCFVGLSYEVEGNMLQAERHYRDVLRECEAEGGRNDAALMATALLGEVLYERGELGGLLELLEPHVDLLERATIPDAVLRVLLVLARAHRLAGRRLECLAYLDRLEDHATSLGLDRLLSAALLEQMNERLRALQFTEADALLERLEALDAKHAGSRGTLGEIAPTAAGARILRALAHGEMEAAAALLPRAIALELLMTGRRFSAAEAERWGLVNRVVPAASLMDEARALAGRIAEAAPLAVRAIKATVTATEGLSDRESFAHLKSGAVAVHRQLQDSEDAREGPAAFAEKRKPVWKGR